MRKGCTLRWECNSGARHRSTPAAWKAALPVSDAPVQRRSPPLDPRRLEGGSPSQRRLRSTPLDPRRLDGGSPSQRLPDTTAFGTARPPPPGRRLSQSAMTAFDTDILPPPGRRLSQSATPRYNGARHRSTPAAWKAALPVSDAPIQRRSAPLDSRRQDGGSPSQRRPDTAVLGTARSPPPGRRQS